MSNLYKRLYLAIHFGIFYSKECSYHVMNKAGVSSAIIYLNTLQRAGRLLYPLFHSSLRNISYEKHLHPEHSNPGLLSIRIDPVSFFQQKIIKKPHAGTNSETKTNKYRTNYFVILSKATY